MKRTAILAALAVVIAGTAVYWWVHHFAWTPPNELRLYGNLDLRQVNLAFNGNERIETVLVREGDRVEEGQVVATMETQRLKAAEAQVRARVEAQRQVVARLENGTRPQEIDQARANVNAAKADLKNSRLNYERLKKSAGGGATSQQDMDTAKAALDVAEAKLDVNQKALDLAVIGPRKEDIAEARATLLSSKAEHEVSERLLSYATLVSPTNGVVQNRILEPGEMASPQRAVLSIAITDPKWVRVYAEEPDLGKIRMGMTATVTTDSFPGKEYAGWVGFISPVASFTPKTVETTELRSSLVYEVRIFVKDPADELRLGMPATVRIPLTGQDSHNGGGATENGGG
jgi:HlyD family secretion protein